MKMRINGDQALWLRTRFHGLVQKETGAPAVILNKVVGLQAQDYMAACLSMRVRTAGISLSQIEAARQQERSIVRTWLMRGTLHLVAAEDFAWILPLLGPLFARGDQRRLHQLGWEPTTVEEGLRLLTRHLEEHGACTRTEIVCLLEENNLPSTGQAPIHLIFRAAMMGLLVQGEDRGKETSYVQVESWVGRLTPLSHEEAVARLARRYLQAYAPASPSDFAHWSGLPMNAARSAWETLKAELVELDLEGKPVWLLETQQPALEKTSLANTICLLPRYDTYWMGYTKHQRAIPPGYEKKIFPGGGIIHPAILMNGKAIGSWRSSGKGANIKVKVDPFIPLDEGLMQGIGAEERDLRRFYSEHEE